ncbi:MAG TPA: glycosyltransferase family 2 protein [Hyphomonas sp.]|nr:glycosyltransferase family 2 protein [Hyphomonas sp.]MCB9960664.1 glycosyltransferase family 2 protein [Hyphomonas sp.]HPE47192.1 glycosyltransferase family 2 protein [Hyphomonas sp.]
MKVSVILPCYNGASTVGEQLDALARQTYKGELEVVFVNNGSSDNSVEIAESYSDRLPGLRVVNAGAGPGKPIGHVSHSYTVGFGAVTGDVIFLCESDDIVEDNWLEILVPELEHHDFVAPSIDYVMLNDEDIRPLPENADQTPENGLPSQVGPLFLTYANCCAIGMTRACFEKVGMPSTAVHTAWDVDYCWRVQLAGMKLHFVPEAVVHYRVRNNARARINQAKTWGESHTYLLIRYGMPSMARYVAYCGWRLFRTTIYLGMGMASGKKNYAYWVWPLAFAIGQTKGIPILARAKMGAFKDMRIKVDRKSLLAG